MYETNIKGIEEIVKENEEWRSGCINLIASENVTSKRVRKAMASDLMHRYAEGHPGERYYRGTGYIDRIETGLKEKMKNLRYLLCHLMAVIQNRLLATQQA